MRDAAAEAKSPVILQASSSAIKYARINRNNKKSKFINFKSHKKLPINKKAVFVLKYKKIDF